MALLSGLFSLASSGGAELASSIDQFKASKRAERREKRANRIERARADVQRSIERRRAINRARQAQAFNIAGIETQGIGTGSSAFQGSQAALGANLGTSLAEANRSFVSQQQVFDLRQSAAATLQNARANAALTQTISGTFQNLGSVISPPGGGGVPGAGSSTPSLS